MLVNDFLSVEDPSSGNCIPYITPLLFPLSSLCQPQFFLSLTEKTLNLEAPESLVRLIQTSKSNSKSQSIVQVGTLCAFLPFSKHFQQMNTLIQIASLLGVRTVLPFFVYLIAFSPLLWPLLLPPPSSILPPLFRRYTPLLILQVNSWGIEFKISFTRERKICTYQQIHEYLCTLWFIHGTFAFYNHPPPPPPQGKENDSHKDKAEDY